MTNATVSNVRDVDERMLTLSFNGQEKTISVADRAPIVGDGSGLEARRDLFVPARRGWGFVDRNRRRRRQRRHVADVGASSDELGEASR